jgi:GNAT superfamily N-acetyltransferase
MTAGELAAAADANLAVHATWLLPHLPGARVRDEPDLVLADSGLPCDTFNFACRARLAAESAPARIAEALRFFAHTGHPFSWWVGPGHAPARLPELLREAGLEEAETELAMALPLSAARESPAPPGLEIRRVSTPQELAAYARLSAANWLPPDPWVLRYYDLAAPWLLDPASRQWLFLGLWDGAVVATASLTVGGGVVGVYNVATLPAMRRRGIGSAMTLAPLLAARRQGHHTAILQAAPDGVGLYRRLGFQPFGQITEFKPPAHGPSGVNQGSAVSRSPPAGSGE